jgi:hypothetical protein
MVLNKAFCTARGWWSHSYPEKQWAGGWVGGSIFKPSAHFSLQFRCELFSNRKCFSWIRSSGWFLWEVVCEAYLECGNTHPFLCVIHLPLWLSLEIWAVRIPLKPKVSGFLTKDPLGLQSRNRDCCSLLSYRIPLGSIATFSNWGAVLYLARVTWSRFLYSDEEVNLCLSFI